ncbi:MAG: hypothetical protein NXI16_06330 [Alphaproteobacteria bacterium]|nr:hypothetical protein [Alphaproteobacteria bacterium]
MTGLYIFLGGALMWTVLKAWEDSEPARVALVEAKMEQERHQLLLEHHSAAAKGKQPKTEAAAPDAAAQAA